MAAASATGSTEVDDVVPDRRDDRDRAKAGGSVSAIAVASSSTLQLEPVVRRDPDEAAAPEAERHAGLLDRRVGLGRGVDAHRRATIAARPASRAPAQGDERRRRGRVGDEPVERIRQAERLAQPADDDPLELGRDRRRPPEHRVLAERRGQHLAEDPGPGRGRREVGQEARVLPVRRVRLDEPAVVVEDRPDRLGRFGRGRGNSGAIEPGSTAGRPRNARPTRGSRPSGRRRRGRPRGTPPGPCRAGRRSALRRGCGGRSVVVTRRV